MMMPHHGDVGTIHCVFGHLIFGTLRTIIVVGVRCGTGFLRTSRQADLVRDRHCADQHGHEKRDELPTHDPYVNSVSPYST
jgi:hypothetical protein